MQYIDFKTKNKYNLTFNKIKQLKIKDRGKVCSPLFWRNDVIQAWCISGSASSSSDRMYCTDSSYWIGIYDTNAKEYAGEFRFDLYSYGGMYNYEFNEFFQQEDIENENDLQIQEMFLEKINQLIDFGILSLEK